MWPTRYKYDVFISHAVEDKLAIANELTDRLEKAGLRVWFSGRELMAGDSLEKTIHRGLAQSRYGVVVLSHKYLQKNWTIREFYALLAKEISHRKVIIPILFGVSVEELQDRNMIMADKWAIPESKGMDFIVQKILEVINTRKAQRTIWEWIEDHQYALKLWIAVLCIMALLAVLIIHKLDSYPSDEFVYSTVKGRVLDVNHMVVEKNGSVFPQSNLIDSSLLSIQHVSDSFANLSVRYRNDYTFDTGLSKVRSRKRVEEALGINLENMSAKDTFHFASPKLFLKRDGVGTALTVSYSLVNSVPVEFDLGEENSIGDHLFEVTVHYKENIRAILVTESFPGQSNAIKRKDVLLMGFTPSETYVFERHGPQWKFRGIK